MQHLLLYQTDFKKKTSFILEFILDLEAILCFVSHVLANV